MMRPDELQTKMDAVDRLRRAVERLRKAEAITGGNLYYQGHQGTNFTDSEINIVREALVAVCRDDIAIKAQMLRNSGIDPSSLLLPAPVSA